MTNKFTRGSILADLIRKEGIHSTNPKFETKQQAKARKKANIRALKKYRSEQCRKLAKKLNRCAKGKRCKSGACPVCYGYFRKQVITSTLNVIPNLDKTMLITWLCYKDAIPASDINDFSLRDLETIKNRYQQQLRRLKLPIAIIGSFEMVYLPEDEVWLPHFHCIALTDSKKDLEPFRKYLLKNMRSHNLSQSFIPFKVERIAKNHSHTIGYCYKPFWTIKRRRMTLSSRKLKGTRLKDSLLALERLPLRNKLFLYNSKSIMTRKGLKFELTMSSD